jgi:hypothetical protein
MQAWETWGNLALQQCAMVMLIPNFGEKKNIFNQHPLSDIRLRLLTPNVLKC